MNMHALRYRALLTMVRIVLRVMERVSGTLCDFGHTSWLSYERSQAVTGPVARTRYAVFAVVRAVRWRERTICKWWRRSLEDRSAAHLRWDGEDWF